MSEQSHNPASDPMNGPNRLFLERTKEQREYDAQDWPGSNNFHPPHIRRLFQKDWIEEVPAEEDEQPPTEE